MAKRNVTLRGKRTPPTEKTLASVAGHHRLEDLTERLAALGRAFYSRGWVLGTSGNFSAVVSREPIRIAITSTGLDKGRLTPEQFLEIDSACKVINGKGKPSAEALLHVAVVSETNAGAVLHTHSVWGTLLSGRHAAESGIALKNYEMLKGLEGVHTH